MSQPTARELLARADEQHRIAHGADMARVNYRLRHNLVAHRKTGLLGWVKDRSKAPDPKDFETLAPGVATALYEALGIVKRNAEQAARELEARVTTEADR